MGNGSLLMFPLIKLAKKLKGVGFILVIKNEGQNVSIN